MGRVFFNTRKNIDKLTGAYTVLVTDTGKDFILNGTAGAAITLPSVANKGEGWNCRFTVGTAFATTNWTIVATAAILQGGVHEIPITSTGLVITNGTTLTLVATTETVGDFYELMCDGTNIYVTGSCAADGGATIA